MPFISLRKISSIPNLLEIFVMAILLRMMTLEFYKKWSMRGYQVPLHFFRHQCGIWGLGRHNRLPYTPNFTNWSALQNQNNYIIYVSALFLNLQIQLLNLRLKVMAQDSHFISWLAHPCYSLKTLKYQVWHLQVNHHYNWNDAPPSFSLEWKAQVGTQEQLFCILPNMSPHMVRREERRS